MMKINLKTDTPVFKATMELVEKIGNVLPERMKDDPLRIILTGGVAASLYSNLRTSRDVDAILSHRVLLPQDIAVSYIDTEGTSRVLSWDTQYHPSIGLIHPDAEKDAIFVASLAGDKVRLMVLNPTDLAVTKIGRFYENDRNDIIGLAKEGLLDAETVKKRYEEALSYYVGDLRFLKYNIRDAVEYIHEHKKLIVKEPDKQENINNTPKLDALAEDLQKRLNKQKCPKLG